MKAVDLFAGAGGWDLAAEQLGIDVDGVEIMPEAQATRSAAGLKTTLDDVREFRGERGSYDMVIASPPCQSFSMAGGGAGRRALDAVLHVVGSYVKRTPLTFDEAAALTGDERTALVVEPLRAILAIRPEYVALEQVPPVLPVWRAYAHVLEWFGYSVATGYINAEQHGVPQTRKRAVLMARRDGGAIALPAATHSRFHVKDPARLDEGVTPWVSMAEALGWPSLGVAGFPRQADREDAIEIDGQLYRARDLRDVGYPAQTITEKARSWSHWVLRHGNQDRACERAADQPAGTLFFGQRLNAVEWHLRHGTEPNSPVRHPTQPAATLAFGHNAYRTEWFVPTPGVPVGAVDRGIERRRLSLAEAAILQSFPDGFQFAGSMTKQFLQVGNAFPPLVARAVLTALTKDVPPAEQLTLGWAEPLAGGTS